MPKALIDNNGATTSKRAFVDSNSLSASFESALSHRSSELVGEHPGFNSMCVSFAYPMSRARDMHWDDETPCAARTYIRHIICTREASRRP